MHDFTNISRSNSYELIVDKEYNYIIGAYYGLWDKNSQLEYFLEDIKCSINELSTGFSLVIDMTQYKGCMPNYIHLHEEAQNLLLSSGLNRTAVVLIDNPLLKANVDFIFQLSGISPTYFSNMAMAEQWVSM